MIGKLVVAESNTILLAPADVARALAERSRALRLARAWTQVTIARRAGVTAASYRRFETTGKASLELVLRVAHALGRLDGFADLLKPPPASTLAELEQRSRASARQGRKRGVR